MTGERSSDPWPQRFGPSDWASWSDAGTAGVTDSGVDALAALLHLRWAHHDRRRRAEVALIGRPLPPPVLVVSLAGAVASGKSTMAAALADRLRTAPTPVTTAVVSTDGFLRPNDELDRVGLTLRKGFPETYDLERLRAVHRALRAGDDPIAVPVYAHDIYDVASEPAIIDRPQVLLLEGVNALQGAPDGGPGPGDLADVTIYLHVDEDTVIGWFVDRFVEFTEEAVSDPSSFYRLWSDLPEADVRRAALEVWDSVNGVNLREHIAPSRSRAQVEVVKGPSHAVIELRLHPG